MAPGVSYDLNIVETSLDRALGTLARQTGTQLIFNYESLRRYPAPPLVGVLRLEQALDVLLENTPFVAHVSGEVVAISPAPSITSPGGSAMHATSSASNKGSLSIGIAAAFAAIFGGASEARGQEVDKARDLDAVVVTADRRGERKLIDTPIAISAYDGTWLEDRGYHGLKDFLQLSPGVSMFELAPGDNRIQMRGMSAAVGEANVGYYIDEVPISFINQSMLPDIRAFDMDRIEVLRGPQGTLYGAGALAGVVRAVTRKPSMDSYEFKTDLTYSATEDGGSNHAANFAGNIPLVKDRVGLRMAYLQEENSGWIDQLNLGIKDYNSHEMTSFRLKLVAELTERLSASALYWKSDIDSNGDAMGFADRTGQQLALTASVYDYAISNLTLEYAGDSFGLISSTSRSSIDNYIRGDFMMGETLDTLLDPESFTQEIRAYSTGSGPWQWSAGAYYRDANQTQVQDSVLFAVFGVDPVMQYDIVKSKSVFAEVTRTLLDGRMDVTIGGRYLQEDRSTEQRFRPSEPFTNDFTAFTPRVNLTYRPAGNWMTYFNYSKGFRSGINQFAVSLETAAALGVILPVAADPEYADSYEFGLKGAFLDNRLTLDAAVFRIEWQDMQAVVPIVAGSLSGVVNAANATSPGVELALNWRATERLRFGAMASWNDAKYGSDVVAHAQIPGSDSTQEIVVFRSGTRINDVPEWTAGLTADYTTPIFNDRAQFVVRGAGQYTSIRENRSGDDVGRGDAMFIADLRMGVETTRWGLHLFANNLFDEGGSVMEYAGYNPGQGVRLRPRTIGLNLKYFY